MIFDRLDVVANTPVMILDPLDVGADRRDISRDSPLAPKSASAILIQRDVSPRTLTPRPLSRKRARGSASSP